MSISDVEVKKIAKLSRLKLSDERVSIIAQELNNIESLISDVKDIDCDDVEPLCSVHDSNQIFREDIVKQEVSCDEILANSPGSTGNFSREVKFFIVPKVVE